MFNRVSVVAALLCGLFLAACGMTDEEAAALSEAIVTDMEAAEINREVKESQDFDRIAEEAVAGMDTSGLDALTQ
ncbi:MAG: hypothetical protein AAGI09_04570 [Pseudomonadota bacterium]